MAPQRAERSPAAEPVNKPKPPKSNFFFRVLRGTARLTLELTSFIPGPVGWASNVGLAGLAAARGRYFQGGMDLLNAVPFGSFGSKALGAGALSLGAILHIIGRGGIFWELNLDPCNAAPRQF